MILSHFARNLREQNWTAIWIEFVLLVVGVFLGIQVSNWNHARKERALISAYLDRIAGNVSNSIPLLSRLVTAAQFKLVVPAKAGIQFFSPIPG